MNEVCWLDMDGVLVDFLGGISRVHNRPLPYSQPENRGSWDVDKLWGITVDEFWAPVNAEPTFWETLQPTAEATELVSLVSGVFGVANVGILTAAAIGEDCFLGKRRWLQRHFPQFSSRLAYAKDKGIYASPRHVLLDDKDTNIESFQEAGGWGILIPRLWNSAHAKAGAVVRVVAEQLARGRGEGSW